MLLLFFALSLTSVVQTMSTDQEMLGAANDTKAATSLPAADDASSSQDRNPKRAKKAVPLPASVVVQFKSSAGEVTGPQIDLPTDSTAAQLELLINELRQQGERKVSNSGGHTHNHVIILPIIIPGAIFMLCRRCRSHG